MKYIFSDEINFEYEAVSLICMHYGKEGYRAWMESSQEKAKFKTGWLEERMEPLIAIEEEVFGAISVSEEDYYFYFENKTYDSDTELNGLSLAAALCEIAEFCGDKKEDEKRKAFAAYSLPEFVYKKEAAAPEKEEFYRKIRSTSMDAEQKWNCFEIYCSIEEHMNCLKEILKPVVSILKQHETEMRKLIRNNPYKSEPYYLNEKNMFADMGISEAVVNFAVFAFPEVALRAMDGEWPNKPFIRYGIYVDELVFEKKRMESGGLQIADRLKSLSDRSRIKILCLLKEREMFGQELKEALGLSNATISHHMNELLMDNFVTLRKEGSKVIYTLNREKVREALEEMRHVLVD